MMRIDFGAPVRGIAGKELGDVDGVVVDAGTKRMHAVIVSSGLFNQTKHMIEVSAIQSSDDQGIRLDSTSRRAEAEAEVLASEEVAFAERVTEPEVFIPAAGVGGPIMADDPAVPGQYPHDDSFFLIAPIDPPPVEVESNLLENQCVLDRSTDAHSSDGHKVGEVVSFTIGDMGRVDSITVSEGFLFKERSTFPLADIDEFGTNAVHLKLTRAQAEAR
jgi:uncharacterized protein YrrD